MLKITIEYEQIDNHLDKAGVQVFSANSKRLDQSGYTLRMEKKQSTSGTA